MLFSAPEPAAGDRSAQQVGDDEAAIGAETDVELLGAQVGAGEVEEGGGQRFDPGAVETDRIVVRDGSREAFVVCVSPGEGGIGGNGEFVIDAAG